MFCRVDAIHMHNKSGLSSAIWAKQRNALSAFYAQVNAKESLVAIRVCKCQLFDQ
jgi:hypothetical protein